MASYNKITYSGGKKRVPFTWLHLFVLMCVFCFVFLVYICFVLGNRSGNDCVGVLHYHYLSGHVELSKSKTGRNLLYFGQIGKHVQGAPVARKATGNGFEYSWENGVKVLIEERDVNCTSVTWHISQYLEENPKDCFNLTGKHWFGGGELYNQVWPFESAEIEPVPFYPQDIIATYYSQVLAFGPVLGRYWLTSDGTAILVNQSSPLVVSVNSKSDNHSLCLIGDPTKYPPNTTTGLSYVVCQGENAKEIHQGMLEKFFKKPRKGPNEQMLRYPVWSTWVKYHKGVSQRDVKEFLGEITAHNFSCSQIEIDDRYSTKYGDYDFDPEKFPNPKYLIDEIHSAGCHVTTWVHPFVNVDAKAYDVGKASNYFVAGSDGKTVGLLEWWNGIGAVVDFTNPSAKEWYLSRLQNFSKSYDIDSFKFDGGSVTHLPYRYHLNNSHVMPSNYSVTYATVASEINNMVEVRVGDNSQDLPVFVRFLDRTASWSSEMGLQSVIPTVLTFGILGYPFILPDMIGGNGDPHKELFIRWMQLNTFLPAMQFSHSPWDFDNETIAIARKMFKIREDIFPTLLNGVENAVKTGEPIIRPLWWIAPGDSKALTNSQQFMVADDYLVAPVLEQGASNITVYLPKGRWEEQFGGKHLHIMDKGGTITYSVQLDDVIYFKNAAQL